MNNKFFWFWVVTAFIKLIISGFLPLSPDEAYYWVWTHYPQLSYFDHPPFVAWLMSLGHLVENYFSFVRWPGVLFLHSSYWIWIKIWRRYLTDQQIGIWSLLWVLNPLTGLGSLVITPDLPLMFFWPLALLALLNTIDQKSLYWALILGLSLGWGFCSKYNMAIFALLALLWLTWEKKWTWKLGGLALLSIGAFLLSSWPVWLWNIQNEGASFRFQLNHGLGKTVWKPYWTESYLLGQVLLLFPIVFWVWIRNFKKSLSIKWMTCLSYGPLLIFFFSSFRGKVEANWPLAAYPFVFAIVAPLLSKRQLQVTAGTWFLIWLLTLIDLNSNKIPPQWDLNKAIEIKEMALLDDETRNQNPLFVPSYQIASSLSFRRKEIIYKLKGNGRFDFFDTLKGSLPTVSPFYFLTLKGDPLPDFYQDQWKIISHIPMKHPHIRDKYELLKVERK